MHCSAHHTSLTSYCHPLPPFTLPGRLLNSIFKSIAHTPELKQRTHENNKQARKKNVDQNLHNIDQVSYFTHL